MTVETRFAWSLGVILASTAAGYIARKHHILREETAGHIMTLVANMFHIKPQEASALFMVSSVTYLLIGIPLVLRIFG